MRIGCLSTPYPLIIEGEPLLVFSSSSGKLLDCEV